ncbi:phosphate acyltransferase [Primorskyibacter sp. S87]|uniref:phosphate acyltransferase n=1 Tax=Primorskyibacter sp. S87 TaxID=3415126 RepID=UPI003C7E84C7
MSVLDNARRAAEERQARIVFPEIEVPRVAEAVGRLRREGLCVPVELRAPGGELAAALAELRGLKPAIARRMVSRPLFRAAAMVALGEADTMVAGAEVPTRRVIEAASIALGLADGVSKSSSFFLMVFPDGREMIFADCAVNVAPDADVLTDIAKSSADTARALLGEARVALLSFSTGSSGEGDSVKVVRQVAKRTGFAGPLQADAALNPVVARTKGVEPIDPNVLVFPSLDAGNIAYKLCRELAGAQAIGPFLQGFRRPVCDLSRGASAQDIVDATILTAAQV